MVLFCKLLAQHRDFGGYTTFVFENLDRPDKYNNYHKYLMCVMWPNWEHDAIALGDEGYLSFEERRAGIDTWWDGDKFIKYKYDNIQFMKFILKPKETDKVEYII